MDNNTKGTLTLIISSAAIVLAVVLSLVLLMTLHKENEMIIEKCYENFDKYEKITIKKDGLFSPVVCEKE